MQHNNTARAVLLGFPPDESGVVRERLAAFGIDVSESRFPPDHDFAGADLVACRLATVGGDGVRALCAVTRAPVLLVVDRLEPGEDATLFPEQCAFFVATDGFAGIESTVAVLLAEEGKREKYRSAYHDSMNGICTHRMLYDGSGKPRDCLYLEVNDAFAGVTGISRERAIGRTIRELFPGEDGEAIVDLYVEALASGAPSYREIFFRPTEGWYRLSVTPRRGDEFTVYIENASSRKEAELALRKAEWHFRSIVDSGLALIWTSDSLGRCDYFNRPWLDFTGRSLERELGDGWVEGVHPDDLARCVATYSDAFASRTEFRMEYRLRAADGSYRWIEDRGSPRHDESGAFVGYVGHCLDVDARRKAESELREKMDELERFHRLTVDREMRIIELKREVNELLGTLDRRDRYASDDSFRFAGTIDA